MSDGAVVDDAAPDGSTSRTADPVVPFVHDAPSLGSRPVPIGEYLASTCGQRCPDAFLSSTATIRIVTLIETLSDFGQKQRVRIETEDETTVEASISQFDYVPDENLRLELAPEESDEYERYQIRSHAEDGTWTPIELRGYHQERGEWTDLGTVADATPADESTESEAEESQEDIGTDESTT